MNDHVTYNWLGVHVEEFIMKILVCIKTSGGTQMECWVPLKICDGQ